MAGRHSQRCHRQAWPGPELRPRPSPCAARTGCATRRWCCSACAACPCSKHGGNKVYHHFLCSAVAVSNRARAATAACGSRHGQRPGPSPSPVPARARAPVPAQLQRAARVQHPLHARDRHAALRDVGGQHHLLLRGGAARKRGAGVCCVQAERASCLGSAGRALECRLRAPPALHPHPAHLALPRRRALHGRDALVDGDGAVQRKHGERQACVGARGERTNTRGAGA